MFLADIQGILVRMLLKGGNKVKNGLFCDSIGAKGLHPFTHPVYSNR
jgi:hypothetical protein